MSTTPAEQFSASAAGYATTMAPSLRPVAEVVVRRARLRAGERVLDIGTGTGSAAAAARGEGREVVGVDAAPGMLEIARREVAGVRFEEMDFAALRFDDASVDVVLAAHSLLFADDQAAALAEWLRVTRPGGRLSLSVPGPLELTPIAVYGEIYAAMGHRHQRPISLRIVAGRAGHGGRLGGRRDRCRPDDGHHPSRRGSLSPVARDRLARRGNRQAHAGAAARPHRRDARCDASHEGRCPAHPVRRALPDRPESRR